MNATTTRWNITYVLNVGKNLAHRTEKDFMMTGHSCKVKAEKQFKDYLKLTIPSWQKIVSVSCVIS